MSLHKSAFIGLSLLLVACANTATNDLAETTEPDPRKGEEVRSLCFASNIDSFGETTRRSVVVTEGRKDYLIETYGGCFNLDFAQSIALDSYSSCLGRGDKVYAFDSVFGPNRSDPTRSFCTVKAIYKWNEDATEDKGSETVEAETQESEAAESGLGESEIEETGMDETETLITDGEASNE